MPSLKEGFGLGGQTAADVFGDFDNKVAPVITGGFNRSISNLRGFQNQGLNALLNLDVDSLFNPSIDRLDALRGSLDPLEGDLRRGALASTQGASLAAVQGARVAAGGRGGLAFGGGAGAIGARAAQQASVGQSTALANSLVQARTARAGFESDLASRRAEVGSAKVGAAGAQQAAQSRQNEMLSQLRAGRAQGLTQGIIGSAGLASGADQAAAEQFSKRHKFSIGGSSFGG